MPGIGGSSPTTWWWRWGATSCLDRPRSPRVWTPDIVQLHSAAYRNVAQLREGRVLVVGVGNSGAEIALDVAGSRPIWLAGTESGRVPFRHDSALARYVFLPLMFRVIGHRVLTRPHAHRTQDAPQAAVPCCAGRTRQAGRHGRCRHRTRRPGGWDSRRIPRLQDGRALPVENAIWCTGFGPDFSWIDLPVFGQYKEPNEPVHVRGIVADEPGCTSSGCTFSMQCRPDFFPAWQRCGTRRQAHRLAAALRTSSGRDLDQAGESPAHRRRRF